MYSRMAILPFVILILMAFAATAQPPDTLWTKTFGGSAADKGNSVQQTHDGGYIIAGGTSSFGVGGMEVYLVKTDVSGNPLWTRTYGGTGGDEGLSVQQTSDDGYIITGWTSSCGAGGFDFYLIKTDASGDTIWTRAFGGSSQDQGYAVQQTDDGGYIIVGKTMSYGSGSWDVYLIKTDELGNESWTRTYGGASSDGGYSVQQTSDGGYIVTGETVPEGAGGFNAVYLVKTDAWGDTVWTRTFGGSFSDGGRCVRQTEDGGYIVAGHTGSFGSGGCDFYLIKTDASGSEEWSRTFGGNLNDYGNSVQQTEDGGYILTGYTMSYGAGLMDVYLVKTDASGIEEWSQTLGGTDYDVGNGVQQTDDAGYIVAGYTESYGAGNQDIYLIRLEAEAPPDLSVTLAPHNPPIVIPASGGRFQFDVAIENTTAGPITADAWIDVIPPGGAALPLIVRTDISFPANTTISRPDLTQNVPSHAPAGFYTYLCSVGEMMGTIIDSDQFTFEKLAAGEGPVTVTPPRRDWNLSGWEDEAFVSTPTPEKFAFIRAYPNPFNPTTTIRYQLSALSFVNLSVYDVSGRKVAELVNGWREAGNHEVTFDGSGLNSGLYFCRIEMVSGSRRISAVMKMVLMK